MVPAQTKIFDPGIAGSDDDETELLLEAAGDAVRIPGARALSFREGEFQAGEVAIKIFNVLFDTGALHKSYISAELVDKPERSGVSLSSLTRQWLAWRIKPPGWRPRKLSRGRCLLSEKMG